MIARWLPLLLCVLLAACADPEKAWEIAEREDTNEGYLRYLAQFPDGARADAARARMDRLREVRSWERAEYRDRIDVYRRFVESYPDSEFAPAARARIAGIQRERAWEAAEDSDDRQVLTAFLRRYPDAPQADRARQLIAKLAAAEAETPAPRPPEPPGDFRVQLGAFRTAAAAETEVRRLVARFADTLGGPVRIETPAATGRSWFLLRSAPMDCPTARATCRALRDAGQDCCVVNR